MMKQLRERIIRMLKAGSIIDKREQKLEYLLKTKKWNPYCISHSVDYLSGYGLNKKSKVVNEFETASKVYQTKNGK